MSTSQRVGSGGLVLVVLFLVAGCRGQPKAVEVPAIDPEKAAQQALATYDKNNDGQLAGAELDGCPALRGALGRYDKNGDRKISKQELMDRFTIWSEGSIGMMRMVCTVEWDGQPLSDAKVEFIPEEFFGAAIVPASGTTDSSGRTTLAMDPANLPSDFQEMRGIQQGLYKIKITHPNINLPPKYNTETTLGKEVTAEFGETAMRIPLTSR